MPTTTNEAGKILQICQQEDVPVEKLARIFRRLKDEVGEASENDSVKQTMRMLDGFVSGLTVAPTQVSAENGWLLAWGAIVVAHFVIWVALWLSCLLSLIYQPWYITMFGISFCVYLIGVNVICPVTVWENHIRRQLGWPTIRSFTNHYFVRVLANLSR